MSVIVIKVHEKDNVSILKKFANHVLGEKAVVFLAEEPKDSNFLPLPADGGKKGNLTDAEIEETWY